MKKGNLAFAAICGVIGAVIMAIAFGYPVCWLACAITTLVYYFCIFRYENSKRLTNQ